MKLCLTEHVTGSLADRLLTGIGQLQNNLLNVKALKNRTMLPAPMFSSSNPCGVCTTPIPISILFSDLNHSSSSSCSSSSHHPQYRVKSLVLKRGFLTGLMRCCSFPKSLWFSCLGIYFLVVSSWQSVLEVQKQPRCRCSIVMKTFKFGCVNGC